MLFVGYAIELRFNLRYFTRHYKIAESSVHDSLAREADGSGFFPGMPLPSVPKLHLPITYKPGWNEQQNCE